MRTAARAPFHVLRSAMVATTIVTLAAAAHVVAGGQLPTPAILAAFLALTSLASTAATRLKLTLPGMAGLLGAGQVVLHEAFSAFSGPSSGPAAAPAHHAALAALPVPADHLQLHNLDSALTWSMFAGHALATLACAALLARGEEALWSLAAWLRPLIELPVPVSPRPAVARVLPSQSLDAVARPWRNLRPDCRRGPPAAVALP